MYFRFRDYNDDGYRVHPNDRYPDDQRPNDSFQDPHSGSFQGLPQDGRYNDYPDDPYQRQQQDPDRRHEGLPQVQDDPFADDPFRQKQRSLQQLQQLRDDDPYPRGPSPGGGSDRMGMWQCFIFIFVMPALASSEVSVVKWLGLPTVDHEVLGCNSTGGGI